MSHQVPPAAGGIVLSPSRSILLAPAHNFSIFKGQPFGPTIIGWRGLPWKPAEVAIIVVLAGHDHPELPGSKRSTMKWIHVYAFVLAGFGLAFTLPACDLKSDRLTVA